MNRVWTDLRLWINEKETLELTTGSPPALTAAQRDAINVLVPGAMPSALVSAPAPDRGPVVNPEFDQSMDWISRLNYYTQRTGQPAEFEPEVCNPGGRLPVGWMVFCKVNCEGTAERFPNKDYGFLNGKPPCFSNKKDARRYASMCAMQHINNLISPPAKPTTSTAAIVTSASQQKLPAKQPAGPEARGYKEEDNGVTLTNPPADNGVRLTKPPADDAELSALRYYSDSDPTASGPARKKARADSGGDGKKARMDNGDVPDAFKQVTQLCKELGMPAPHIEGTPYDYPTFFNARAIFPESLSVAVPPDLGVVTGIFTKKAAKEASAMLVLEWLKGEERERDGTFNGLVGRA